MMANQEDDTDGLVIKIPTSLLGKRDDRSKEAPKVTHDYDFFRRTNIVPFQVKRNSEHGTTEVQSLRFIEDDQRLKVLRLLDFPGLYNQLPNLLDCLYQLGCECEIEKRHYAAVAVSELANKQPFLDLKEAVILPWAKDENPEIRHSASVALAQLLNNEHNKLEVLTLLNHWISLDNPLLIDSALSTYCRIANSQPNEALNAIAVILKANSIIHYPQIIDLFGAVYGSSPNLAVDRLHTWLLPVTHSDLCWIAGVLSLTWIQLNDTAEDENTREKVVNIIFTLWDNPKMLLHEAMQENTTTLIEIWAREAVEKMNKTSSSCLKHYQAFFYELYKKYEGRRNRLDFYLKKWERDKERERDIEISRASRGGAFNSLEAKDKFSYRHLLP